MQLAFSSYWFLIAKRIYIFSEIPFSTQFLRLIRILPFYQSQHELQNSMSVHRARVDWSLEEIFLQSARWVQCTAASCLVWVARNAGRLTYCHPAERRETTKRITIIGIITIQFVPVYVKNAPYTGDMHSVVPVTFRKRCDMTLRPVIAFRLNPWVAKS